ncbi:MAG: TlyA family RNA methyltransferase, partial [Bradyrhizobium sp.]
RGLVCLDVGASTGGFTDVLLSRGAARVYAVDVGRGQLHPRLKAHPRVISKEALDVRKLTSADFQEPPQFITCDVSFISLKLVLPTIVSLAPPMSMLVALIKPQFEVGPGSVVKGIVKDEAARTRARDEIESFVQNSGCMVAGVIASPIEGGDGNHEYLIGARKTGE